MDDRMSIEAADMFGYGYIAGDGFKVFSDLDPEVLTAQSVVSVKRWWEGKGKVFTDWHKRIFLLGLEFRRKEDAVDIPFGAYGNCETRDWDVLGEFCECPNCGESHKVENAEGKGAYESNMSGVLQYVKCGEKIFMVGIKGKKVVR
jgi:hypothetical protein